MKKGLIFLMMSLFAISCSEVSRVDSNGYYLAENGRKYNGQGVSGEYTLDTLQVREGKAVEYLLDGSKEVSNYVKGLKNGKAILYYKNNDRLEFNYKSNVREGKAILYRNNGDILYFNYGKNGKINGRLKEYLYNGLIIESNVVDGYLEGKSTRLWPNGDTEVRNYKGSRVIGEINFYSAKGDHVVIKEYNPDPKNESRIDYLRDGSISNPIHPNQFMRILSN